MSTDKRKNAKDKQLVNASKGIPRIRSLSISDDSSSIRNLVNIMSSVRTDTKEAKLNETSISDGKGGRIGLDFDDYTKKK